MPRLGPAAFEVSEDGQPKSFSLSQIAATPPRLILLFDTPASLPPAFMGQGAVTIGEQVIDELYALYPQAEVRFAKINPGDKLVSKSWAKDIMEAKAQAQALLKTPSGSAIWEAVAAMEAEKPTVIVIVSDGQATDKPEPAYLAAIAGGAPIVSLGVGNVTQVGQWENENVTMAMLVILGVGAPGELSNPGLAMTGGMVSDKIGGAVPAISNWETVVSTLGTIGVDTGLSTICPSGNNPCD